LFSSKDSEKFVAIAEHFAARGIAVLRYDHRGCGESEGDIRNTTVTSRLADLDAVCEFAMTHSLLNGRIGLLGSSMGGFISIFKGASDDRIRALSLWATPAIIRNAREEIESNAREEGVPLLNDGFYQDCEKFDARQAIEKVARVLVLHGESDELVPVEQAHEIYAHARTPKHLEVFRGGDHRFTDPGDRLRAIKASCRWFKQHV
jgi:hypothetical protein